jgi:hypothetical protein
MAYTFTSNEVVCPACETQFTNNRVNGLALVEVASSIESRKRMHCRLTLNALEREFKGGQLPPAVKKAVLDGYNDLSRDILTILGFGTDVE